MVESMSSLSLSQSSGAPIMYVSPAASEQSGSSNSGSSTCTTTVTTAINNASSTRLDRQMIQFFINTWILVVALLAVAPLVPRNLTGEAYGLSFIGTMSSSLYTLYIHNGKPRAWNLPAFYIWFQSIIVTKDFVYLVYCFMFIPFPVVFKFALLPLLCRVIEQNAKFLRCNFSHSSIYRTCFNKSCLWAEANSTALHILSSNVEVALGFLLILSLFSWRRSVIQTFIYWQLLKLMYHAPATASYHKSVWACIGLFVSPVHCRAPFVDVPLATIQRWWLN